MPFLLAITLTALVMTCSPLAIRPAYAAPPSTTTPTNPIINDPGCLTNSLAANDDGSTDSPVSLPFTMNFFGDTYNSLWINNNGNVTFNAAQRTYTPYDLTQSTPPIIAPFFADVDTRGYGSQLVTYGDITYQGRPALCVNWVGVGYYQEHTDLLNSFQLLLVGRSDVKPGDSQVMFNYGQIKWETGDASSGGGGKGGISAGVGFSKGNGDAHTFYQLPGSLTPGQLLDSDSFHGLVYHSLGSTIPGRYVFQITGSVYSTVPDQTPFNTNHSSASTGYGFQNRYGSQFLSGAHLQQSEVIPEGLVKNVFTDVRPSDPQSQMAADELEGGWCFGMTLSAGRFDSRQAPLVSPQDRRSDGAWSSAASNPNGAKVLPNPANTNKSSKLFSKEMIQLLYLDHISQKSAEFQNSFEQQKIVNADPLSGYSNFVAQLDSVLGDGVNLRAAPFGNPLNSSSHTGMGLLAIEVFNSQGKRLFGHAVLVYGVESTTDGGVKLKIWDSNVQNQSQVLIVHSDGSWNYYGPSSFYGSTFTKTYSFEDQPSLNHGYLAVVPLYRPHGLLLHPPAATSSSPDTVGAGALMDVPAGFALTQATDAQDFPVTTIPIFGGLPGHPSGQTVNFPSGGGSAQLSGGTDPVDVRGSSTTMTVSPATRDALTVTTDDNAGSVQTTGNTSQLTVARPTESASASGATGLTLGPDGSVTTSGAKGNVVLTVTKYTRSGSHQSTIYSGRPPTGTGLHFSPQQIAGIVAIDDAGSNWFNISVILVGVGLLGLGVVVTVILMRRRRAS